MLQKLLIPRCFRMRLVTLISGAALVNCASAQHPDTSSSSVNRASSIAVVSGHPTASRNGGPSTTPVLSIDAPAANKSSKAGQTATSGERTSLEMIAPQAQAHIDYAMNLAERGAVQSAQAEFILALDLIADALDADTKNTARAHARAVQAGLTAIEETKDFVPADTPHNVVINLAQLAATHQTPVLKDIDVSRMTRAKALQHYHTYATQQLAFAGGRSAIASSALYGLGRAECVTTAGANSRNPLGGPNAMALYQSALLVDPRNYMASNELGVLMARFGDLESAAGQLTHSLSIKPQVETWHNLATVYRRMGQQEKAEQAERERAFRGYIVDENLMKTASRDAIFLHCLPAHRGEEVSEGVIEGKQSRVWDEAENRLHVQKAIMATLMGEKREPSTVNSARKGSGRPVAAKKRAR